ncbi:MAG: ribonuclease III [Firmicutes bacterium]|jgi:ribonuclease-3|nr:ribonuclease III [Bacillota bacterium]
MKKDLTVLLAKSFHIAPRQKELYLQALTHSSYAHEHNLGGNTHNERLEFLGDAVLELAVSEILYHRFPRLPEGKLTRFRAGLVCEESLARLAEKLQLGSYLRLGRGEAASGGRRRPSLLADALEALLGAIYLDQGFAAVRDVVEKLFQPLLHELEDGGLINDFKTLLQEYTQAKMGVTPEYIIVDECGPDHEKIFTAQLLLDGRSYGEGSGRSKKEAEQEAAREAYERLVNGK